MVTGGWADQHAHVVGAEAARPRTERLVLRQQTYTTDVYDMVTVHIRIRYGNYIYVAMYVYGIVTIYI